jgi:hypothetical protein
MMDRSQAQDSQAQEADTLQDGDQVNGSSLDEVSSRPEIDNDSSESDKPATEAETTGGSSLDEAVTADSDLGGDETSNSVTSRSSKDSSVSSRKQEKSSTPKKTTTQEKAPIEANSAAVVQIPDGAEVGQGERIVIEDKGFSIVPPVGWMIELEVPRVSLSMVALVPEGVYPSNINVIRFNGPMILNQQSAGKFAEKIIKDFPSTSPSIESYTLRDSQQIQLTDGRQSFLFYVDFISSGKRMMQAHVLTSSQTNHYLMTYTDLAENFEPNAEGMQAQVFNAAWETLASLELDSPSPVPSKDLFWIVGSVVGLLIFWFVFSFIRNRRAAAEYRKFSDGNYQPEDSEELLTSLAQVGMGQKISLEPTLVSKRKADEESVSPELAEPLSEDQKPIRGKKIKVSRKQGGQESSKKWEDLSNKASDVSSIEFSQDPFKR